MKLNTIVYSSERTTWETPQFLFDDLNKEFGFIIDLCADATNHKCDKYFDLEQDSLKQDWGKDQVCWMNPPFGRGIEVWVQKAYEAGLKGNTVVCLFPVRTDTKWWHNYVMKAYEIRLMNRRISFEGSKNKAPFPSCIVIFNGKNDRRLGIQYV